MDNLKYIVTSDIHLGHLRTPTSHVIKSFISKILTEDNQDADILFISGDLFDRLLDFNSKDVREIVGFCNHLLEYCQTNDILLRVLEGTPSHDWEQSEILVKLNQLRKNPAKLNYVKILDIEYIEEYDKYVLYVPDEWTNSHEDLETQIQEKLLANNISQVDIAILHGQFFYQLPIKDYKGFYFKEEYFLKIVKGYIHVGHYHIYTSFDRILANGSLERLAHGEEDPKGYIIVNNGSYRFVENDNAYIYKTLLVNSNTTYSSLDKRIYEYPEGSFIRLRMTKDHPFNLNFQEIRTRYLNYDVRKLVKEEGTEEDRATHILTGVELDDEGGYMLERNIHEVLYEVVTHKYELSTSELSSFKQHIQPLEIIDHGDQLQ